MIFRAPKFFYSFKCLADKCTDSCCAGWEIPIDDESYYKYKLNRSELGEKLRASISDDGGAHFELLPNGRCPFLCDTGLCEIINKLGEDALCDICREHPRYYSATGEITEGGLGLACIGAAELILADASRFETVYDGGELSPLQSSARLAEYEARRESIRLAIYSDERSFSECLSDILCRHAAAKLTRVPTSRAIRRIFESARLAEPLDADWSERLSRAEKAAVSAQKELVRYADGHGAAAKNLLYYFIHRYYLLGAKRGDGVRRIRLAALSTLIILAIAFAEGERLSTVSKDFSKNIEYSEQNVALFLALCKRPSLGNCLLKLIN